MSKHPLLWAIFLNLGFNFVVKSVSGLFTAKTESQTEFRQTEGTSGGQQPMDIQQSNDQDEAER